MSRVAVVGMGAIGSTFAAELLGTNRHEVLLLGRTPRRRLIVTSPDGTADFAVPTVTNIGGPRVQDWVLVAVKATQCEQVAGHLTALTGPATRILMLQNGVESRSRMAPYVDADTVVECVVRCAAERLADGSVRRRGAAQLVLADDGAGREVRELFGGSAAQVILTSDLTTALWRKLCVNVSGGAITALTMQPMGALREPRVSRLAAALIAECAAVGRACGAQINDDERHAILVELLAQPAQATTSMMRARLGAEPLEHDAISGAVLRGAERHGISVPVTRAIDALLSATTIAR